MNTYPPLPPAEDLRFRLLDGADLDAILALYERCATFVWMTDERAPDRAMAEDLLTSVPPNTPPERKEAWGAFQGDRLVGLADWVWGYPRVDVGFVGLLLLDPALREGGRGAAWWRVLEARARGAGLATLRLGVHHKNGGGFRFWRRMGFREIYQSQRLDSPLPSVVVVMEKRLRPPGEGA